MGEAFETKIQKKKNLPETVKYGTVPGTFDTTDTVWTKRGYLEG